jgi:hypothetical protein
MLMDVIQKEHFLVSTSDASRKEIFAATAAFVAVQVVYVDSVGGGRQ